MRARVQRLRWSDWGAGFFLFAATAAIVIWQNSRLAVLWDLSYVLENAARISLGDVPYRDFPFPYAPLTFLIQAALIKVVGRVFWHTIVYCAIVGGTCSVLTWRIILSVLQESPRHVRLIAFVLSAPLFFLGIYCIFPHPFYDPDCTFAILLSLLLLLKAEQLRSWWIALVAGVTVVIPLFTKQNTGLAFLLSVIISVVALTVIQLMRRESIRVYACVLAGAVAAMAIALLLIQHFAGLANYWHWTIKFAATRRTPALSEMIGVYADKMNILWLAAIAIGAALIRFNRTQNRMLAIISIALISMPFVWPAIYLLHQGDPSERADRLLAVWPVLLVASFILSLATIKRQSGIRRMLPFVLIATIHGAFMSQQLWGSTYAIWPLFLILSARFVGDLNLIQPNNARPWLLRSVSAIIALSLILAGGFYVKSHERLSYANLDDGDLYRSTLPQLKALSTRGDWLPQFEELIRYTDREIPRDEGILLLPGEDLFYYTTGRRPRFPVLMFDHTVNPYTPEEILKLARDRDIRWVVIKQDLQNEDEGVAEEKNRLSQALEQDFESVESLDNYEIYKRKEPGDVEDEGPDSPAR